MRAWERASIGIGCPGRRGWLALAAAALLAVGRASAAAPPQAAGQPATAPQPPAEAPPAPPQAIPTERVFRAADELDAAVREAVAAAGADPALEEIEQRLGAAAAATRQLRAHLDPASLPEASARELDRLRQAVAREDLQLAGDEATLEKRSEHLAGVAKQLQERLAAWELTETAAQEAQAPPAVVRRIAQALETLRGAAAKLRAEQDRVLGIQGKVSDLRVELARAGDALRQADAALQRNLFEVESAPLWSALVAPGRGAWLGGQLRQALRECGRDIATFVVEEQARIWLHLLVVAALALGLRALRRPVASIAAGDAALRAAVQVLARPVSAAVLLSATLLRVLYPPLSPYIRDLFFVALLVPLLRLLPGLVPELFRRPLHRLALLFALDRLAELAPPRTLLARLCVLAVAAVALGGIAAGLRPQGWVRALRGSRLATAARIAALAALGLLAVSVVASVAGNSALAASLEHATLASATLGVVLLAVGIALESALTAVLHLPALQRRRLVARHRAVVLRRTVALLRLTLLFLWARAAAGAFGVDGALGSAAAGVLGLRLKVGGLDVSLRDVVAFGVTLAVGLALARFVRFVLDEGVFAEFALPRGVSAAVSTTVQYVLVVLGFSWAVLASGMEMNRFSILLGTLGVGIGFGLQNVVNNFVSGLILLYERPIQVGDVVDVGTVSGEVSRIGIRSSTVRTFAGAEVIVPNATLISTEVTNWTLSDRRRRIDLAVGVAYGTPPERVIELLLETVRGRVGVLDEPAPVALFLRLGESALEFTLRFWTADFDRWVFLASEVLTEVLASLGRAGIEVPFPQRDLHVRSLDAPAALGPTPVGRRKRPAAEAAARASSARSSDRGGAAKR